MFNLNYIFMKKINLLLLATLVAFGALFTSCKDDGETNAPVLAFSASQTTVNTNTTIKLVVQINKGDNKIEKVQVKDGANYLTDDNGKVWNGVDASGCKGYLNTSDVVKDTITITPTAGTHTYSATAYDSDGNASSEQTVTVTVASLSEVGSSVTIYCTLGDGSTSSTCASATGVTYAPTAVTSSLQSSIDFVYFNAGGTALAIYAPSAVPSAISSLFSSWATKNATKFLKTTAVTYSNATFADVAALSLSSNTVTGLAVGDVVAFETAGGKFGVFKVNSITSGYSSTDNVNVSIKYQN
jgi:uncharacterized membrane protein